MPEIIFSMNGIPSTVSQGTTLLEAARSREIEVATLFSGTRGGAALHVWTYSDRVQRSRRVILELHWSEYPERAATGDILGRCELTEHIAEYRIQKAWMPSGFRPNLIDDRHPLIGIDVGKCIGCGRCEQACREIAICDVLAMVGPAPAPPSPPPSIRTLTLAAGSPARCA